LLKQGDEEALSETVAEAARGRSQWMKQRRQGMWTDKKVFDTRDVPSATKQLGRMIFGGLASRLDRKQDESSDD
ncbi:MAG: hypothetical protein PVH50_01545, partial [Anaerolineae bacterium]